MDELKPCQTDEVGKLVEATAQTLDERCKIWQETLNRAYKDGKYNKNTGIWEADEYRVARARYTLDAYRDALALVDTLGQQIDDLCRATPENKPLTHRDRLIAEICAERTRQDDKWGFPQENTYCEWSSILAEETGELAKELNELNFGRGDVDKMLCEAVQVAAVALSIMEHEDIAKRVTWSLTYARKQKQEAADE